MKKIMIAVVAMTLGVAANAAAVGWSLAGATNYKGDAYQLFVIGQNGATSIATITALLDAGKSTDSYAFGTGAISNTGLATVAAASSGKTLDAGNSYTAFIVVFDSASPTAGDAKYAVVSEASGLTQNPSATAAQITFAAGSAASVLNNTSNWKSYGAVPEPTSGLLLLLGVAGLALKRKRA